MPTLTAEQRSNGGKAAAEQRKAEKAELLKLRELFATLDLKKPDQQAQEQTASLDFANQRLTRVRAQLVRLDSLASEETDPKRLKEYADATSRLQEQERQLSGRPLPGTLKPSSKPARGQSYPALEPRPIEPVAQPVPTTNSVQTPKPSA